MTLFPRFLKVEDLDPLLCFSLRIELRILFGVVYFCKIPRKYEI